MSVTVEKQYKLHCLKCKELEETFENIKEAIDRAEEHLEHWDEGRDLNNYGHEVEILEVNVVRYAW